MLGCFMRLAWHALWLPEVDSCHLPLDALHPSGLPSQSSVSTVHLAAQTADGRNHRARSSRCVLKSGGVSNRAHDQTVRRDKARSDSLQNPEGYWT